MNTGRNQTNGWEVPQVKQPLFAGGNVSGTVSAATENWDGTAWSTSPATLAAARQGSANGIGTSSSNGIQAGGYTTAYVSTVEEYNFTANTVTAAAWSSGGAITNARYLNAGAGTVNAGVTWGGRNIPIYQDTQNYDGTSWTSSGNYPKKYLLKVEQAHKQRLYRLVERIQVLLLMMVIVMLLNMMALAGQVHHLWVDKVLV